MAKYLVNQNVASFKAGDVIDLEKVPYALEAHVTKIDDKSKIEVATPKQSAKASK